jgi:hypothetical protein
LIETRNIHVFLGNLVDMFEEIYLILSGIDTLSLHFLGLRKVARHISKVSSTFPEAKSAHVQAGRREILYAVE